MIVLVLVGLTIFMFLFAKLVIVYATRLTESMVTGRLQDLEWIMESGIIPTEWSAKPKRRYYALLNAVRYHYKAETSQEQEKLYYMVRLHKLMRYVKVCPFFEDDSARKLAQERLNEVHESWLEHDLNQILPQPR